ncbi:hypothetical protein ABT127_11000 [Streptomyces sp. NPDC001904]|uniref:hypothetical protein n=1 Tax=Streptomyces sp. NPDC001904 TaxID=3154531 RepID=UPI0033309B7D
MTPRTPRTEPAGSPERPLERRLHDALAARADSITVRTLRPAEPPGPHLRRLPLFHRDRRRFAPVLAGLATAAALVAGYLTLAPDAEPHRTPVPPAAPSAPAVPDRGSTPGPSRTPETAVPSPSASAPPTGPDRTGTTGPTATPSPPG